MCQLYDELTGQQDSQRLITFVQDRPGHDLRYAIEPSPHLADIGWQPQVSFEEGLRRTLQWYLAHPEWWQSVRSGQYQTYYERWYGERLKQPPAS